MDLAASGDWSAPEVRGEVTLEDASLRLRLLPQALTSLAARVVFDGHSLRVPRATATMGGGDIEMSGDAKLRGGVADARFAITGRDISLTYPPGLRSRLAEPGRYSHLEKALWQLQRFLRERLAEEA